MRYAFENGKPSEIIIGIDFWLDIVYLIDMLRIFSTPFQNDDNKWVYSKKRIALRYLKCDFWVDLYGFYPLGLIRYISKREDGDLNE